MEMLSQYSVIIFPFLFCSIVFVVDPGIWQHVARLYPALVQCVTCSSVEVRTALREALLQFSDLIHP